MLVRLSYFCCQRMSSTVLVILSRLLWISEVVDFLSALHLAQLKSRLCSMVCKNLIACSFFSISSFVAGSAVCSSVVNRLCVRVSWNNWRALAFVNSITFFNGWWFLGIFFCLIHSFLLFSSLFFLFFVHVDGDWEGEGGVVHRLTYFYGKIFVYDNVVTSIHHYIYLFWDLSECSGTFIPTPHAAFPFHHTPWPFKPPSPHSSHHMLWRSYNTGAPSLEVGTRLWYQKLINDQLLSPILMLLTDNIIMYFQISIR